MKSKLTLLILLLSTLAGWSQTPTNIPSASSGVYNIAISRTNGQLLGYSTNLFASNAPALSSAISNNLPGMGVMPNRGGSFTNATGTGSNGTSIALNLIVVSGQTTNVFTISSNGVVLGGWSFQGYGRAAPGSPGSVAFGMHNGGSNGMWFGNGTNAVWFSTGGTNAGGFSNGVFFANGAGVTNVPESAIPNLVSDLAGKIAVGAAAGGDLVGTLPSPTLAAVGSAGTYGQVTTDAKGRVTAGTVAADIAHGGTGSGTTAGAAASLGVLSLATPNQTVTQSPTFNGSVTFGGGGQINMPSLGYILDTGTDQNQGHNPQLGIRSSPYSSGSGLSLYSTGTNAFGTNGTLYATVGGTNYYFYDPYAVTFLFAGQQATRVILPGVAQAILNGQPFAIASTTVPGGLSPGNYAGYWFSPTNATTYFPKFASGKLYPTDVYLGGVLFTSDGGPQALVIHHDTGSINVYSNLTVGAAGGTIIAGTGGVALTLANGKLNLSTFDSTQAGTLDVSAATVNALQFVSQTGVSGVSIGTFNGEGIGKYAGSSGGLGIFCLDDTATTPAIKVDNRFSGTADVVTIKSNLVVLSDISIGTAGTGLKIKSGSNAKIGTATANGVTAVVVANTNVTANSLIFLTEQSPAGTPGAPYVSAVSAGTSFSFKSVAGDTSTVGYMIVEKQ